MPLIAWLARAARDARRFARARRGTTALEFALVAPIFLLVICIIIENGLMLFAQSVLDSATRLAARQVMIGAVTTSSGFQTAMCANVSTFLNCSAMQFYVASSSSAFPSVVWPSSTGTFSSSSFSTGSGGDYVLVEVAYNRNFVAPMVVQLGRTGWVLLGVQAFQNEPFS